MAIKTFTAGAVLTAADTNTYLANSGLVYVTSVAVGTAVSNVTVSNCFNSTYDNYQIIYTGGASSTTHNLSMQMSGTSTGYYGTIIYSLPSTAGTVQGLGTNNGASWTYAGDGTAAGGNRIGCTIYAPNLALRTGFSSQYIGTGTGSGAFGTFNGNLDNNTQYTGFVIGMNSGTITGGTITVYGFRKA